MFSVHLYLLLLIGKYATMNFLPDHCVQTRTFFGSLFIIGGVEGVIALPMVLSRSPFSVQSEFINIDNLLCGTERNIWHVLRAGFSGNSTLQIVQSPLSANK